MSRKKGKSAWQTGYNECLQQAVDRMARQLVLAPGLSLRDYYDNQCRAVEEFLKGESHD